MKKQMQGMIYVMLAAVLFGVMPLWAVKVYDNGGNPVFLSFCRFALSLPLLYLLDRKLCPHHERAAPDKKFFLVCITYVLTPSLLFISYTKIASGLATTVHFIYPAIVLLLCRAMFRQSIRPVKYFCCFLVHCGRRPLLHGGGEPGGRPGASACAALRHHLCRICGLSAGQPCAGDPGPLPADAAAEPWRRGGAVSPQHPDGTLALTSPRRAGSTPYCSVGGPAVGATMLFQRGVQLCGAQNAAIFSVLEPLTSVVCGILFLSESCSVQIILGIVLILAAVFLLSICDFRRKEDVPA